MTRAKVDAWTTYPKVKEANDKLGDAAMKLAAVAGKGVDALKGAMGAVWQGLRRLSQAVPGAKTEEISSLESRWRPQCRHLGLFFAYSELLTLERKRA